MRKKREKQLKNIYRTRAFVELFYRVRDFRYMALYRVFVVAILFLFTCMLRVKSTELMIQKYVCGCGGIYCADMVDCS